MRGHVQIVARLFVKLVHFVFFPDEFIVYSDIIVRALFALYYLPVLAIAVALTHSLLEAMTYGMILPLTRELEFQHTLSRENLPAITRFLYELTQQMFPFLILGGAVCTLGHKCINGIGEAMVDACSKVDDCDYPLLAARLLFMTQKPGRRQILVFSSCFILALIAALFYTDIFFVWSPRDPHTTYASWGIIGCQVLFVFTSVVKLVRRAELNRRRAPRHPAAAVTKALHSEHDSHNGSIAASTVYSFTSALVGSRREHGGMVASGSSGSGEEAAKDVETGESSALQCVAEFLVKRWWRTSVHRIRHLSTEMVVLCGMYWCVVRGPVESIGLCVEVLLYLNLPHLTGFLTLSFAVALARVLQSFFWLNRHRNYACDVLAIVLPQQVAIALSLWYFEFRLAVVLLFSGVSVLLWARAIQLLREFLTFGPDRTVEWRVSGGAGGNCTSRPIAPHLAALLEDAFERQHMRPSMVSLDLSLDLKSMTMRTSRNGPDVPIERIPVVRPAAEHQQQQTQSSWFARNVGQPLQCGSRLFLYAYPRLLTLQSAASHGGRRFRNARILLRLVTMSLLLVFMGIVAGTVVQAVFPALRPLPVIVQYDGKRGSLTVDHFMVKLGVRWSPGEYRHAGDMPPTGASTECRSNDSSDAVDLYPALCGKSIHGVSLWELAWLATSSYLTKPDVEHVLAFMNDGLQSSWEARHPYGRLEDNGLPSRRATTNTVADAARSHVEEAVPSSFGWDAFTEFYDARRNVSVIAIRGTDLTSFADALQDVNLFFEAALFHVLSSVVPGASLLPSSVVADFIKFSAGVDSVTDRYSTPSHVSEQSTVGGPAKGSPSCGRNYYAAVEAYVRDVVFARPGGPKHTVLVGHSMGGAVGHIVGVRLGLRSVGFSSPGVMLSHKKFKLELKRIHQLTTTVVTSHDVVPFIGGQGGEVLHVDCFAERRELCHAMEFAVGALWKSCPSIRSAFPAVREVFVD